MDYKTSCKTVNGVKKKYDITLTKVGSIGFSAMMHGYMAFDKDGELLVPFEHGEIQ